MTLRLIAFLRRVARPLPASIRRRLRQLAKLVYWTVTLQLGDRVRTRLAGSVDSGRPPAHSRDHRPDLADLCDPYREEPGPRTFDPAFLISVLTPTYNTDARYLRELFQTLRNQQYGHWEWVVADDGSSDPRTIAALRELAAADPRVRLTCNPYNLGISGASNTALAAASGHFIALVDHDDLVSRDAFQRIHEAWLAAPTTQLFFTDECKLLPDGTLDQFWPKPDWSPAYLENTMCLGHLAVYRTEFIRALGGFRPAYDGTQDFDLALRAALAAPRVVHLPIFAYLWRVIPGSAATDLSEKHYAIERQGKAVLDYARQRHPEATVAAGWGAGYWRITYPLPTPAPLLSYVIPTGGGSRLVRGHNVDLVLNCIRSFEAQRFYPNREYVVVHNGDLSPGQLAALRAIDGVRLVPYDSASFNLSTKINLGAAAARGAYLCLLNDDVEAITPRGGDQLVSYLAANATVGAIGPMALLEDGTIQQNGLILSANGPAHAGAGKPAEFGGHQAIMRCRREAFGIGGAMLITRTDLFQALGGFDADLPLNYNDVDFAVRVRARGLTCVIDPDIRVHHYESATKLGTSRVEQEMLSYKHPTLHDPYFNAHFKQDDASFVLALGADRSNIPFGTWLDRHIGARASPMRGDGPRLSVCVSIYDQPRQLLQEMYASLLMQTYRNVDIVLFDNGSTHPETRQWLDRVRQEGRISYARAERNLGIDGGNARLLELMTGEFFVAVDADDFIAVDALEIMARAIQAHPDRHVFYSDEYKSNMDSVRFAPFFKPDFDPILLMNCCYPAHLMAMRADFLRRIGAFTAPEAAWSHDYDTLTRALAIGEEPVHVRELTYAWRINPGSTASVATGTKPETPASQLFALERLLDARGLTGRLKLEPKRLETSTGMWSLRAVEPVPGLRTLDAATIWGPGGRGLPALVEAAESPEVAWVAILTAPDRPHALLDLSALAWLDERVVAVGGLFVRVDGMVQWSGGLFLAGGRLFDPYAGQAFSSGGYHGQLWCQRCVDVVAPTNVLIRADALRRVVPRPEVVDADTLMVTIGLQAHADRHLVAVTPYLRAPLPAATVAPLPLDRRGILLDAAAVQGGSRWYDARLSSARPHTMPGMA